MLSFYFFGFFGLLYFGCFMVSFLSSLETSVFFSGYYLFTSLCSYTSLLTSSFSSSRLVVLTNTVTTLPFCDTAYVMPVRISFVYPFFSKSSSELGTNASLISVMDILIDLLFFMSSFIYLKYSFLDFAFFLSCGGSI